MRGETERAAQYVLVLLLGVLTALWGAFLVPLRVAGVPVPVAVVVAAVANVVLGTAGGRLYGRLGAALPGVVWFAVVATLQSRTAEGDLVVPGSATGLALLLVGTVCATVPVGLTSPRARPGRHTPGDDRPAGR
ncbi:MAG: hypothetical protein JWN17_514 [Frankiales bacterium]|nr:hypothetical protein [Frankiales bacterium]